MNHESLVVLRVFLKSGPVLDILLPRPEAFGILEWWKTYRDSDSIQGFTHGATPDGANYILRASEIAALVVVPHQPQQQAPQQTVPSLPPKVPPFGGVQFPRQA